MRNSILFRFLIVFAGIIIMYSCKKEELTVSQVNPDTSAGTATIKGVVKADLTMATDTLNNAYSLIKEVVTTGKVIIRVENEDYYEDGEGYTLYTATIGSDGTYSIDIPVSKNGVTTSIIPQDFEYDYQNYAYDISTGTKWEAGKKERKVFTLAKIDLGEVYGNMIIVKDLIY